MTSIFKAFAAVLMLCVGAVLAPPISYAQTADQAISRDVAIAIAELEKDRAAAVARIQECEATILKSQAIVTAAKAKGSVQAEQIATTAIKKAEAAKAQNENTVKMIDGTLKNFKRPGTSPESISAEERALAKTRIAEARKEIATIQEHLKACIEGTTKTLAEREVLERKISEAYDKSWKALQEGLVDLGTLGLKKVYAGKTENLQKNMDQAWKTMRETSDPNRKSQLLGIIDLCQNDMKTVEYNTKLIQHAGELKTSHDVYQWDQNEAPTKDRLLKGMDLLFGTISTYYTLGKMNYVALSSLNAELSAWHRLREIDKENAGCSAKASSLSFRMEHKMQESHCLERCLDNPVAGCADKCRGKTALSTPPPLLE
jgi:hypothetical protein